MDNMDKLRKAVTSGAKRSNAYEALTADEQHKVDAWVESMHSAQEYTSATISSYKSYVCKALIAVRTGETMTNDMKSATRAFVAWVDMQA